MHDVKITVLMPAYNAAKYIAEAIESVLMQTFRHFELLIINDGSTDDTLAIIKSFSDERIVVLNQNENLGIAAALNNGLKHARADYIARFDADDICYPERLEKQYHFMHANPTYIIIGSAADYMDALGNYVFTHHPQAITNEQLKNLPVNTCPFIHAGVMYKKEIIKDIGYHAGAHSFEDHLLWKQVQNKGKFYNLPDRLISVRLNPCSITMDERKRPGEFHVIKNKTLSTGFISMEDSSRLLQIIGEQNRSKNKQAAYYALLAKKYLWNNYNPSQARLNLKKAIRLNAFDFKDYLLLFISYLPENMIKNIYSHLISFK